MNTSNLNEVQKYIAEVCNEICNFLCGKNESYGNSALDPIRVFCRASIETLLNARIDDKLSRIKNMTWQDKGCNTTEDSELDLIGYLILKRVYKKIRVNCD